MKKFLSIVMSIVMLLSITAGVDLSAYASGWGDKAEKIQFNTIYTAEPSTLDAGEHINDMGVTIDRYFDAFQFNVPIKGTVTLNMEAESKYYFPLDYESRIEYIIYNSKDMDNELDVDYRILTAGFSSARDIYYGKYEWTLPAGTYYLVLQYDYNSFWGFDQEGICEFSLSYKPNFSRPSNIKTSSNSYSGFTVNWSKVANVDGYLIKYATKSDFSNAAYAKVANGKTTSKTINGRAANTKYYVKVQAYKKVNGVTYKSKWSETKTVKTLEKKAYIKSISSRANGFTVKWDKVNGKLGYQIRYATKPDFSNAAIIYAGNGNATSKTITGRAARKKYYVQIRSYVKQSNGNYKFDAWSPTKTVTTK